MQELSDLACERVGPESIGPLCPAQAAELYESPDRNRCARERQKEFDADIGRIRDVPKKQRQSIKDDEPSAAFVAIVQPPYADGGADEQRQNPGIENGPLSAEDKGNAGRDEEDEDPGADGDEHRAPKPAAVQAAGDAEEDWDEVQDWPDSH